MTTDAMSGLSAPEIADVMSTKAVGEWMDIDFPGDQMWRVRQACQSTLRRARVSIRSINGHHRIYRIPDDTPQKRRISERQQEIIKRYERGETMREIGESFGVSYQRIQQIVAARGKQFTQLPVADRVSAVNEYIAPFFSAMPEFPLCVVCAEVSESGRAICTKCRLRVTAVRTLASRLRAYKKTANRQYLRQAVCDIRKHGLTPQDMEWA